MKKGFTLIEIVIVIVVLSIMGVFTFTFLSNSAETYQMMRTQRELYQEGTYMLERISRELRDGTYISGLAANSITFQKTNYASTIDNSQNVNFYQDGSDLKRSSANNPNKIIAKNISSISITSNPSPLTNQENTTFPIAIVLSRDGQSVTLSTTICPKNYCSGGPSDLTCSSANRDGRSFNRDYQDVIQ
jgi:prepilin-type N-terminal cleavage/methylation domain-containing protein